jgi:hypothetical protein
VSDQLHAPAALPPEKSHTRYLVDMKLRRPQRWSRRHREVKILDPTGTRTPTPSVVEPVASHYTDCDTGAITVGSSRGLFKISRHFPARDEEIYGKPQDISISSEIRIEYLLNTESVSVLLFDLTGWNSCLF